MVGRTSAERRLDGVLGGAVGGRRGDTGKQQRAGHVASGDPEEAAWLTGIRQGWKSPLQGGSSFQTQQSRTWLCTLMRNLAPPSIPGDPLRVAFTGSLPVSSPSLAPVGVQDKLPVWGQLCFHELLPAPPRRLSAPLSASPGRQSRAAGLESGVFTPGWTTRPHWGGGSTVLLESQAAELNFTLQAELLPSRLRDTLS